MRRMVIVIGLMLFVVGCATELATPTTEAVYDPNAPQYAFMEVAEPNWVAAYGDTLETRMVYNISKNRVMTAMVGKRLLALEDPNEVKE